MPLLGSFNALAMWQDGAATTSNDTHLLMIFVGVIAFVSFVQLLALVGAGIAMLRVVKDAKALAAKLELKAQPFIEKTQVLVDDLSPKVRTVMENAQQISYTVRSKIDEVGQTVTQINATVQDTNSKTRAQVTRVNGLVSEALTTTGEVSRTVQDGIKAPIRQAAGIIAGVRAGLETLADRSAFLKPKPTSVKPANVSPIDFRADPRIDLP